MFKDGTKVLVKGEQGKDNWIGTIVGNNEEVAEDWGFHYYIVPEGGNRFDDEMMFEPEYIIEAISA